MHDYAKLPELGLALFQRGFDPVSPYEFYQDIFHDGELAAWAEKPDDYKKGDYTAIAVEIANNPDQKPRAKRYTITNDLDGLEPLLHSENFCVMAPISYAGKSRKSANARIMYALCIEVDGLKVDKTGKQVGLNDLLHQCTPKPHWLPLPTYIVASGTGLHLYYIFEQGIPLFKNVVDSLKRYKRRLTEKLWNQYITTLCTPEQIQFESLFQAFRMPGTVCKDGDKIATAFKVGKRVSIDYMNEFVEEKDKIITVYRSKLTRKKAAELYPEWYERRVVRGDKTVKRWGVAKGHKGDEVYNWWLKRIESEAAVGHRYYCLLMLSVYAVKQNIPRERLEADCFRLMGDFDELSKEDTNRFTAKDVLDALQAYEDESMVTYPINSIQNRSGIHIEKNKRNGRKQADHIKLMNYVRDEINKNENWRDGNGRPTAQRAVCEWQQTNPDGTKAACIRATGLDKKTVYKWWNTVLPASEPETPKTLDEALALMDDIGDDDDNMFNLSWNQHKMIDDAPENE